MATTALLSYYVDSIDYRIEALNGKQQSNLKYIYLSAHDSTVVGFRSAMGFETKVTPLFAASIIFEVYLDGTTNHKVGEYTDDDFYVKMYYNDLPQYMKDVCDEGTGKCPYAKLKKAFQANYYDGDLADACLNGPIDNSSDNKFPWWGYILIGLGVLLILIISVCCIRRLCRKTGVDEDLEKAKYTDLNQNSSSKDTDIIN
jgi:hypothetical protein